MKELNMNFIKLLSMKRNICFVILVLGFSFIFSIDTLGQNSKMQSGKIFELPLEKRGDPYLPNAHRMKKVSPSYKYNKTSIKKSKSSTIVTTQVNVDANGFNILGDAANEPSIAVNPLNANIMAIGWRQFDNVLSNFRQAGWAYTSDGGQSWTFPGVIDSGIFRSDPVLDFDADGNFYFNSLTIDPDTNYLCKVFKSTNGGALWDSGVSAGGGDKQWMAIDRGTGAGRGNIYVDWSQYSSSCAPGFFSRSTDSGSSFENCTQLNCNPDLGTITVSTDGKLYLAGRDFVSGTGFIVTKSLNAKTPSSLISWETPISVFMDGSIQFAPINPSGLLGQAYIDIYPSNISGQDNVFLMGTLFRVSNMDPGDVMFSKSSDDGISWSAPIRLNDDTSITNTQWLGTMSVAPNGRIDVIWLDTRNAPLGSDSSALYYTFSTDQGNTWSVNEQISASFDPHVGYPNQSKMGDYFDMVSDNVGAHLAWTNTFNGEQDVYYSYITPNVPNGIIENADNFNFSIFPNPTNGKFQISSEARINTIEIFNAVGEKVFSISINQKKYEVDLTSHSSGIYILKITNQDGAVRVKKLIKE